MLGIDMLGGAKYQTHAVQAYKKLSGSWAVGVFWKEFGDSRDFINGLYNAGCRTFRVHILWDKSHNYRSENRQSEAIQEYKHCVKFMNAKGNVTLYVSLFCEHDLKSDVVERSIALARSYSTSQRYMVPVFVNNPETGDIVSGEGVINEIHHLNRKKPGGQYIVSPDGETLKSGNAAAYNSRYRDALIRFAWNPLLNCHRNEHDRQRSVQPSVRQIMALANLLTLESRKSQSSPPFGGELSGIHARSSRVAGVLGLRAHERTLSSQT